MNFSSVRFACTALSGTKKQGRLPKDADGYYTMPVGGLNVFNSAGDYYTVEGARELFMGSGPLMRRVKSACLKGEEGHPKQEPGQSLDAFAARVMRIEETRVCAHFSDIWLDYDNVKDESGRPIVAIMAKVAPSGPFADSLERSLENRKEDVCFSVRAFTADDIVRGVRLRVLREVVTFDRVTEPGIAQARKYSAPALESFSEKVFSKDDIISAVKTYDGVSMESGSISGLNLMRTLGWDIDTNQLPRFLNW